MATVEQLRAQRAWDMAQAGVEQHHKDYVSTCKGLPALIMTSGLMQTMAFLEQKGGRHALIGQQIRDWLHERYHAPKAFEPFMQAMFMADSATYQRVNSEVFALLKWLRQFAAAVEKTGG
jgi:CRISPR-associated protein Cmr5